MMDETGLLLKPIRVVPMKSASQMLIQASTAAARKPGINLAASFAGTPSKAFSQLFICGLDEATLPMAIAPPNLSDLQGHCYAGTNTRPSFPLFESIRPVLFFRYHSTTQAAVAQFIKTVEKLIRVQAGALSIDRKRHLNCQG
ncbi:MAG: hypothetical protein PVG25_00760 [Anaerolineae bacterium]